MKAYVITSGSIFALLVLAHIWRVAVEGTGMVADPWFAGATIVSAGLSVWAFRLARAV